MQTDSLSQQGSHVTNYEGALAYTMSEQMELYTAVVTSTLSPMTYEGVDKRVDRICSLVQKCDPVFVAQLAIYARTQMHLRSIPLLLAIELARLHHGDRLVSDMVNRIVLRADEIMELLACYQWRNPFQQPDRPQKNLARLSRQLQKGLQQALNRFDEYQLAKYDRDSLSVTLRDSLFLVHPKAKDSQQQEIFDRIASKSLATPYTWETELSLLGQQTFASTDHKNAAFAAKWSELILSGRLGYMAMLRNLRNILSLKDVSSQAMLALAHAISDRQAVLSSKQLPFRFLSAYKELQYIMSPWNITILHALEVAARHSAMNIQGFSWDTRVVIASDVSGSMNAHISSHSNVQLRDIGLLLSMILRSRCQNVIGGIFGDIWKQIDLPDYQILANVIDLQNNAAGVGFSTNGHKVIEDLIQRNIVADKVMIFTDMQMWDSTGRGNTLSHVWRKYKNCVAPQAKLYLFDLAGYGQSPLSLANRDVYLIAGWSDKIFDILVAVDNGSSALEEIKKIQILQTPD